MFPTSYISNREIGEFSKDLFHKLVVQEQINRLSKPVFTESIRSAQFHSSCINSLDLDRSENRYLLTGGADKLIGIFDIYSKTSQANLTKYSVIGRPQHARFAHKYSVNNVQWYPHDNGIFTSSSSDFSLKIWDSNSLRPVETIKFKTAVNDHKMSTVAVSHNLIAVGTEDSHVYLCDMRTGSNSHILQGHKGAVLTVEWSPTKSHILASGSADNKILIWDVRNSRGHLLNLDQHNGNSASHSKSVVTAHVGQVNGLRFTEDGLMLLSAGKDNRIRVWDAYSGKNSMSNFGPILNTSERKVQIATAPGTPTAFIPANNDILMVDVDDGVIVKRFAGHFRTSICCVFNPYTQTLYSSGQDNVVLIWPPPSLRAITKEDESPPRKRRQIVDQQGPESATVQSEQDMTQDNWSDSEEDNS